MTSFVTILMLAASTGTGRLTGQVSDAGSGRPLVGADVEVTGTGLGAATDGQGNYVLPSVPAGKCSVAIGMVGYKAVTRQVRIEADRTTRLDVRLDPTVIPMGEVRVSAERKPTEEKQPSVTSLKRDDITHTAGAGGDLYRALQALPGVSAATDFSGLLSVRGGDTDENLTLMDWVIIPFPYHFGGLVSTFNSSVIREAELYTGGFPVRYGNALSSVLDVRNREGSLGGYHGQSTLSLVMAEALVEGPITNRSSFIMSGRRSYFGYLIDALKMEYFTVEPKFYDLQTRLTYELNDRNKVWFNGLVTDELIEASFPGSDTAPVDISWRYVSDVESFGWKSTYRPDRLFQFVVSRLYSRQHFSLMHSYIWVEQFWYTCRPSVSWQFGPNQSVDAGLFLGYVRSPIDLDFAHPRRDSVPMRTSHVYNAHLAGSHLGYRHKLFDRLTIAPGMRYDWLSPSDRSAPIGHFSPRFSIAYDIDPITVVRFAWGYFWQHPMIEAVKDIGNPELDWENARHFVLGIEREFADRTSIRVEAYRKTLNQLVVHDSVLVFSNAGSGLNQGIEVLVQKQPTGNLSGYVSYAFSHARRQDGPDEADYFFEYDQPHIVNAVVSYKFPGEVRAGLRWRFASGKPYTPVTGSVYVPDSTGSRRVPIYGDKNSARLPDYHRLDARLDKDFRLGPVRGAVYVEVFNVYARRNVMGYEYSDDFKEKKAYYQFPFLPTAGFSVSF